MLPWHSHQYSPMPPPIIAMQTKDPAVTKIMLLVVVDHWLEGSKLDEADVLSLLVSSGGGEGVFSRDTGTKSESSNFEFSLKNGIEGAKVEGIGDIILLKL